MTSHYDIGVYYFPNYHIDSHNEAVHGPGWTEWELVKQAQPRFSGHQQPKVPLWGYEDEADPAVFAKKIDAAADHGITHFLFDWYWYDGEPHRQRCLEEGYFGAPNKDRLQFALMWANHDWIDIHPAKLHNEPKLWDRGAISSDGFDKMTDYIIEKYFLQPEHKKIDGCPFFSIYELQKFINGIGGLEVAREALQRFDEKTRAAGFPGLHLNAIIWGIQILPTEQAINKPNELLSYLNFQSATSYVWVHHQQFTGFPTMPYTEMAQNSVQQWQESADAFAVPYYPNVTMGWDASPRTCQTDRFMQWNYPFTPVLDGNTPQAFKESLEQMKAFLDTHPSCRNTFTINAWNEWTEGSYLEPDTINGMGYLEAIHDVFGG
ncbi:MAG TPA: glycoside hydrolase family 99-like domain-containing protein [Armatimonadota bacterium]|nr:glycoside hydrolase family 99-like domain-containing protein [Armatimonadota bacterium]